jgi:hypothetical protein
VIPPIVISALSVLLPVTPDTNCRDSRLCAALWTLLIAGATAGLLFLVEFILDFFRDRSRRS